MLKVKSIKFTCSDKFKRKFDDNGDDVIDDDDKEMKKRINKAQFVSVLIFEFIDIIKFYIWILIYNLMKSSNKKNQQWIKRKSMNL